MARGKNMARFSKRPKLDYIPERDCRQCKHYRGKKRGCGKKTCRYEGDMFMDDLWDG